MSESAALPEFTVVADSPQSSTVDILFVPVLDGDETLTDLAGLDEAIGGEWRRLVASAEFSHRLFDICVARVVTPAWRAGRVAFVGAGRVADLDAERLRRVTASCAYFARQRGAKTVGVVARPSFASPAQVAALADGLTAAEFDAGFYKKKGGQGRPVPERCEIVVPGGDAASFQDAVRRGVVAGRAANACRRLANEPANVLTPQELVARISAMAGRRRIGVEVLNADEIEQLGMRLILAVGRGSAAPPQLVVLRYEPEAAAETPVLALVGKGVTFDSGGISIKPAAGMEVMKGDMSGAAAVAAAMSALADLGAPCRVVGVVPIVENMLSGRAMRPGDVVVGASGTSVEITNTDAEGRLILADALWYAGRLGATHVVDVATLTGACLVALGRTVAGLFGNSPEWTDAVRAAGARGGERLWPMPIYEEARDQLKSEIADLGNQGGRAGGASTAAAFLREFVSVPAWAHVDIAGTAWADTRKPYQPKGPTGVAVRTLIELGMTMAAR